MTKQIINDESSHTIRRTFIPSASKKQHDDMLARGYVLDKLSNQYRKTVKQRITYMDGVQVSFDESIADDTKVVNINAA